MRRISERRIARVIRDLEREIGAAGKWGAPPPVFSEAIDLIEALAGIETGTAETENAGSVPKG